eukprot:82468-Rhodomonas_salina.1
MSKQMTVTGHDNGGTGSAGGEGGCAPPVTLDYDPPWAVDTDPGWLRMIRAWGANTTTKPTRGRTGWGGA